MYSVRNRAVWGIMILILVLMAPAVSAQDPLSYAPQPVSIPGDAPSAPSVLSPDTIPYQSLNDNNTIILGSSTEQNPEYIEHTVTVVNEHGTDTVWINLYAGPFGTFANGEECHPTDCNGSECCPSVNCSKAKCKDSVCNKGDIPLPYNGGFVLGPGESKDITVKATKERIKTGSGNLKIWARTGCKQTGYPDYPIVCDTGNCDMDYAVHSRVECGGLGSRLPATVAEITFNGAYGLDSYDISLVDGWNVPMYLEPISGNYDRTDEPNKCTCSGGYRDLAPLAEQEIPKMVYKVNEKPVAVWSACAYSKLVENNPNDAYCCTGEYHDAKKCQDNADNWAPDYKTATFFQNYYPKAFAFAYGDPTGGNFVCGPNDNNPIDYKLTIYGKDRNQATYENKTIITLTPGEPVLVSHPDPGVSIKLESDSSGVHAIHLTVIPSDVPPEYPLDYSISIPTLGDIYHIQSTIPEDSLSRLNLLVGYSDEDYENAGLNEDSLRMFWFDPDQDQWTELKGSVDTKNNIVSAYSDSFGYFTISGTEKSQEQGNISLFPGWNLVSTPKKLASEHDTARIFSGVASAGHSILTYDPISTNWIVLTADSPVEQLYGYWIYSLSATTIPLIFEQDPVQIPPSRNLFSGWNIIGFTNLNPATARDSMLSVEDAWMYVIGYNASVQQYDTKIINKGEGEHTDSSLLYPMKGYWTYMNNSGTLSGIGL